MATYTYAAPKQATPKGMYKSIYGGFEKTPLAGYRRCAIVTDIRLDQSKSARLARIRARKRAKAVLFTLERDIAEALEALGRV